MPDISLVERTSIPGVRRKDYDDWIKQVPLDNQKALRIELEDKKKAFKLLSALQARKRRNVLGMAGLEFARRGNVVFLWREERKERRLNE